MRKWIYLTTGAIIGGTMVCLGRNSKQNLQKAIRCGDKVLQELNSKLEQFALQVENIDEEKIKRRMRSKYLSLKKRIQSIDWQKFGDDAKVLADSLLQEINSLLVKE